MSIVILLSSICSGVLIGIGGINYLLLSTQNSFAGTLASAFFFSFGLYFIVAKRFYLYTGKIGDVVNQKFSYLYKELLLVLIGNLIGTLFCSAITLCDSLGPKLMVAAAVIMRKKLSVSLLESFVMAAFCGAVIYLTVDVAKKSEQPERPFIIVMGVMTFILCKFNHSIADSFYIFASGVTLKKFIYLLTVIFGNLVGGICFPFIEKCINKITLKTQI